jgi:hypothetical protein
MTMELSPTAEATRLVDPCPAAKTPGTLVSSSNGVRARGQRSGAWPGLGGALANDAVDRLVTVSELALDPMEAIRVAVDGQDHRS